MSSLNKNAFVHIEGGRNLPNGGFVRNEWMLVEEVPHYRQKHNNTGLYTTAYLYDSNDPKEANLYGNFYLDFDNEEDFEKVRSDVLEAIWYLSNPITYGIPKELFHLFYSGKKGVHIIIPSVIMGIEPDKYLNEHFKFMAEDIAERMTYQTLDTRIYDRRRLLRLPNSRHQDTGLYKIPLSVEEIRTLSLREIQQMAQTTRAYQAKPACEIPRAMKQYKYMVQKWKDQYERKFSTRRNHEAKPLGFTPPCTQELIDMGPRKGSRNNTVAVLVSHWHGEGLSEQEIWDKLVEWNQGSLSEKELRTTMRSVMEGGYRYGCTTLETLATCVKHQCPLWKGNRI